MVNAGDAVEGVLAEFKTEGMESLHPLCFVKLTRTPAVTSRCG
jgi:hypothetical protein